jgi:multidrug efflux pump subunit AcrA (membrane-fusion protein)
MFGRVRVPASPPYEGLLVPVAATGTEQTRKYVLVVGSDNTVSQRYVTLGQATSDDLVVVKTGIGPDDRLIVNGLMRARPGQKVTPQEQGAPPAGAGPQAKK